MGRFLALFFLLPWWVYIPASLGVVWLAERSYEHALEAEAEKAAALDAGLPVAVDLSDFDRDRDVYPAGEVHVTGWINPEFNYELVQKRNGITIDTRHMFMMFGSADPADAREVRAAVMLTPAQREDFLARGAEFVSGFGNGGGLVFAFNGFGDTYNTLGSLAAKAIAEKGLSKSPDFIFIEPFMDGREAALAPKGIPQKTRYFGWLAAAVVALIGTMKRVMSVLAGPDRPGGGSNGRAKEASAVATAAPAPASRTPVLSLPAAVSEDTPLGRVSRRAVRPGAEGVPLPDVYGGSSIEQTRAALAASDPQGKAVRVGSQGMRLRDSGAVAKSSLPVVLASGSSAAEEAKPGPANEVKPLPASGVETIPASTFYTRLALAMLVVGGLSYDPALIRIAFFVVMAGLLCFGVYLVYRRTGGGERLLGIIPTALQSRSTSTGAEPVALAPGGETLSLPAPVRTSKPRERGVI